MNTGDVYHFADPGNELRPACGARLTKWVSPSPVKNVSLVNCPDCLAVMNPLAGQVSVKPLDEREKSFRDWTIAVVGGETVLSYADWRHLKRHPESSSVRPMTLEEFNAAGVGTPTPRQKPPRMEDEHGMVDGVFEFYDVHIEGCSMEVVPQLSGNVEITVAYGADDGYLFTLSHLDRADLIRALLHDFHYSTERGGPNGDD